MDELTALRTETNKTYGLEKDAKSGAPRYQLEAATGPIHYQPYEDAEKPGDWTDINTEAYTESEVKDVGKVQVYDQMPWIIEMGVEKTWYRVTSRKNRKHIATVELVSVDGTAVADAKAITGLAVKPMIHPFRVGLWKDLSGLALSRELSLKWKVTEEGDSKEDLYPFSFVETPSAYTTAEIDESAKTSISTARTRIDDTSWHWEEIIPVGVKLVDTDFTVAANGDDGQWTAYAFLSGVNYAYMGNISDIAYHNFFRFPNISIPVGSTIDTAAMTVYNSSSNATSNFASLLYFNDVDDATAPTTYGQAEALALTSASVAWNNPGSGTILTSPSIKTPAQEVIDRAGWSSGNAMMVLWKDNGSSSDKYIINITYEFGSYPPTLSLTWTEPATGHPTSKRMGGIPFAAMRRGVW